MPDKANKHTNSREAEIESWLQDNPDFFIGRDHLIEKLVLPHERGDAVSLVERQVAVLRQRNQHSRKQIDDLVTAARKNSTTFENCRTLVLGLINARDSKQFFGSLDECLREDFQCTAYHLLLYGATPRQVNHYTSVLPLITVEPHISQILEASEPFMGVLRETQQDFLFRHNSSKVGSAAVMNLVDAQGKKIGLLSIGSSDPRYFEPQMGTMFLVFIADILASLLPEIINFQDEENKA